MVVSGQADANRIPRATQDRIQKIMREVGYVPNVAARLLRSQRNGLLGVYTYERVFPVREDDYYHDFLVGIEEAAVEKGVDLVLFSSTLGVEGKRVYNDGMNRLRLADGAIFFGLEKDDAELSRLVDDGYPFVFIGKRMVGETEVPYITADYAGGIAVTLDTVQAFGHHAIAYLGSAERARPQDERLTAYRTEIARRGLRERDSVTDAAALPGLVEAFVSEGVTAILAETIEIAEALAGELARRGLTTPEDVSVVVLDSLAPSASVASWSHMALPAREMGAAAVELLLERLDSGDGRHSITIPVSGPKATTLAAPAKR
jgi:DNA-binding LacI/PurR family transcriptional regulator